MSAARSPAARRPWRWMGLAGVAAGLGLAAPALAETRTPAPTEAIGYVTAERSGAPLSWTLPEGAPYLFVPSIGGPQGSVAVVETGGGIGAALFPRPYFGAQDTVCAPEIGSDKRRDLKWRGATARFAPPVEAPLASATRASSGADTSPIASLILYRTELGPPPGALLLDRRLTLGFHCGQAVHKTFFNRIFVPIAAPPAPAQCFNLTGTYPRAGGSDIHIGFTSADRLVMLQPADLDDRHGAIRHRFRVTLYDTDGCRGGAGEFRSASKEAGAIKLDQIGLRDRVRSVKIVYEGGPLAPFYAAPAPGPVARPAPTPPVSAAAATAHAAPPADAPTPAPASRTGAENASPSADIAAPPPPPAPPASANDVVAGPPPAVDDDGSATGPRPAPIGIQSALLPPRLELPASKPAAPAPAPTSQTFEYPVHDIYRLNYCLRWGADCGEPAATAWCKAQGFARASAWQVDKNIGALFPTIVLADKRVCAQFPCDGFQEITCSAQ